MLKTLARLALQKAHLYGAYSLAIRGPLHEAGWFRSFEERRSVDLEGNPLPFITYSAMEFLSRRIEPQMRVFEFGCGASTLWWAARVAEVIACEHDKAWFEEIRAKLPPNAQVIYRELDYGGAYSKTILEYQDRFDVVVIDGRDRVNCARNCLGALNAGGVILWDNTDREKYEPGYRFLRDNGFRSIEFIGLGPIENTKSRTDIYYRPGNCLGI